MTTTIVTSHRIKTIIFAILICIGLTIISIHAQSEANDSGWSKNEDERERSVSIADRETYVIWHIFFDGNRMIYDRKFRERLDKNFREGAIFDGKLLVKSVRSISKMHAIYPITLDNVFVRLDPDRKEIELKFIVRERPSMKLKVAKD